MPSQFYYNVKDVRTKNDILITVKLMLFYELVDVNTMVGTALLYSMQSSCSLYTCICLFICLNYYSAIVPDLAESRFSVVCV